VINSLGWSESPDIAEQVRLVSAAKGVALACLKANVIPLHLSSYRVFGGENKNAYDERDKPSPLGPAGRAYLDAERSFEQHLDEYICLRIGWVLDVQAGSSFSRILSHLARVGGSFEAGHQRRGAPVSSEVVGRVVVAMINQVLCGANNWGVFHCASSDPCTVAEFTDALAAILDQEECLLGEWSIVEPCDEVGALANERQPEPDSAVLSVRRSRDDFGIQAVSWRKGLRSLVKLWLEREQVRRLHEG
jgi:dTDP-4-dehydrorhamnose reductase